VVVYGHTHRIQNKKIGKTLVINPGTAKGWFLDIEQLLQYLIQRPKNLSSYTVNTQNGMSIIRL
jgi:predicted phosphodiesterase